MRAIHRLLLFNSFDAGGGFVRYIPQPMNLIKGIFNTSLGRKYIMAITGAGLFGFIIVQIGQFCTIFFTAVAHVVYIFIAGISGFNSSAFRSHQTGGSQSQEDYSRHYCLHMF